MGGNDNNQSPEKNITDWINTCWTFGINYFFIEIFLAKTIFI